MLLSVVPVVRSSSTCPSEISATSPDAHALLQVQQRVKQRSPLSTDEDASKTALLEMQSDVTLTDMLHRVATQNDLNGICEDMCKEVGAYPQCAQCPGFVAPDSTPGVMTWDELLEFMDNLVEWGQGEIKGWHAQAAKLVQLRPPSSSHVCEGGTYKEGDGVGGTEIGIGYAHSPERCVEMVKNRCPTANGATLPSAGRGQCYCEEGMSGRNSVEKWQSCKFAATDTTTTTSHSFTHICEGGDYKDGDGIGETEHNLGYAHSPDRCIAMVRYHCPTANGATLPSSGKGNCYCKQGMTNWNSKTQWQSCKFASSVSTTTPAPPSITQLCEAGDYKEGDGIGGTEQHIGYAHSPHTCIQMVKTQCPTANGATLPSSGNGKCFCEWDMSDWNSVKKWQSCKFPATNEEVDARAELQNNFNRICEDICNYPGANHSHCQSCPGFVLHEQTLDDEK